MSFIELGEKEKLFREQFREELANLDIIKLELEPILQKYNKCYSKLVELARKFGKEYVDKIPDCIEKPAQLEKIFNRSFLTNFIYEFEVVIKYPQTFNEIKDKPWVCNFPPEMTSRQGNYRDNGYAPCTRSIGMHKKNPNVYFCSVPKHIAYAKNLNLPITAYDLIKMNLPVPPLPTDPTSICRTHVRHKLHKGKEVTDMNREEKQGSQINNVEKKRKNINVINTGVTKKTKAAKKKESSDFYIDIEILDKFSCVYSCPITGIQCKEEGIHFDPLEKINFCDQHVQVDDKLINTIKDNEDNEEFEKVYNLFKNIQLLDNQIYDEKEPLIKATLCKQRYNIAGKIGLGTHPNFINLFYNPTS